MKGSSDSELLRITSLRLSAVPITKFRTAVLRTHTLILVLIVTVFSACTDHEPVQSVTPKSQEPEGYLNHSDSAHYVGMATCRSCHEGIYKTFIRTGMGQSIAVATRTKSAGNFSSAKVSDHFSDLHYRAYWNNDSLYVAEFRLGKGKHDTLHKRVEQVNYIIGSGQHTNSHIRNFNGYLHQVPMTYYTQRGHWDLPPGFENGMNTRFSRKIGLECMSCHNALPGFVAGSENKFTHVPSGIDCERCHGPGSIHVNARRTGSRVDTATEIDRTIVNPAKLPIGRQFDVCQRCHLQGNAVLKEGSSFYSFRPGMDLSKHISVFMPKYEGAEDEFIMASHAERLKLSPCFIRSAEKTGTANALRPFKGAMTCVTCHNPHVSVTETGKDVFNNACRSCHAVSAASVTAAHKKIGKWQNCVTCHMPVSGSTDIPHVTVHDHYIRKPVSKNEKGMIKKFLGLYSVNELLPDPHTRARAYLTQYEKFSQKPEFLDSAELILAQIPRLIDKVHSVLHLQFMRGDYPGMQKVIEQLGEGRLQNAVFINTSYDNRDAWTCYRVAECFSATRKHTTAVKWLRKAVELAPYNPDFRNKLGTALLAVNSPAEAMKEFEFILRENPSYVSAYSNLGYLRLSQGFPAEAHRLFAQGLALDPDNVQLLLNLASYHLYIEDLQTARKYLEKVLLKDPHNLKARQAMRTLSAK
jgi:hypothetical protein